MKNHAHKYAIGSVIEGHTILEFVPKGAYWKSAPCYRVRCGKCSASFHANPWQIINKRIVSCGCVGRGQFSKAGVPLRSAAARWTSRISAEQIKAWIGEGISTAHIARRINAELLLEIGDQGILTKNMVIGRIHRLGLGERKGSNTMKRVSTPFPAPGECLWPIGDPKDANHHHAYCAAPVAPGKPYCAIHAAIAYLPDRPRRSEVSKYAAD